jgi:hypothetical protein
MGRPRLSHETKTRLLDEGVASLIGQGYHGTGIKEVLDHVKVPKGSFYNYFERKSILEPKSFGITPGSFSVNSTPNSENRKRIRCRH